MCSLHCGLRRHNVRFRPCDARLRFCNVILHFRHLERSEYCAIADVIANVHANRFHIAGNLRHHIDFLVRPKLRSHDKVVLERGRTDSGDRHSGR